MHTDVHMAALQYPHATLIADYKSQLSAQLTEVY